MPFEVAEWIEAGSALSSLQALADLTSPSLNVQTESQLPHSRFWVALRDDQPIAYALIWLLGDEIELIHLATLPGVRRQGIARTILSALAEHYGKAGHAAVLLEVRAGNAAATSLYKKCGFEMTRVRRGYYADGEDAWEMRWDLTSAG